jgi:hypothetical protein
MKWARRLAGKMAFAPCGVLPSTQSKSLLRICGVGEVIGSSRLVVKEREPPTFRMVTGVRRMHRNPTLVFAGGVIFLTAIVALVSANFDRPSSHTVTLTWNPPARVRGLAISGYNVYRSTAAGGPYVPLARDISGTAYKDALVSSGRTYYYVVTSVDSAGRESSYSEELKTVIPWVIRGGTQCWSLAGFSDYIVITNMSARILHWPHLDLKALVR